MGVNRGRARLEGSGKEIAEARMRTNGGAKHEGTDERKDVLNACMINDGGARRAGAVQT
jgi:hypothetical protein